jgi:hypothetical protein
VVRVAARAALGFRVQDSVSIFRVYGLGHRVQGLGFKVCGLGFMVKSIGF